MGVNAADQTGDPPVYKVTDTERLKDIAKAIQKQYGTEFKVKDFIKAVREDNNLGRKQKFVSAGTLSGGNNDLLIIRAEYIDPALSPPRKKGVFGKLKAGAKKVAEKAVGAAEDIVEKKTGAEITDHKDNTSTPPKTPETEAKPPEKEKKVSAYKEGAEVGVLTKSGLRAGMNLDTLRPTIYHSGQNGFMKDTKIGLLTSNYLNNDNLTVTPLDRFGAQANITNINTLLGAQKSFNLTVPREEGRAGHQVNASLIAGVSAENPITNINFGNPFQYDFDLTVVTGGGISAQYHGKNGHVINAASNFTMAGMADALKYNASGGYEIPLNQGDGTKVEFHASHTYQHNGTEGTSNTTVGSSFDMALGKRKVPEASVTPGEFKLGEGGKLKQLFMLTAGGDYNTVNGPSGHVEFRLNRDLEVLNMNKPGKTVTLPEGLGVKAGVYKGPDNKPALTFGVTFNR